MSQRHIASAERNGVSHPIPHIATTRGSQASGVRKRLQRPCKTKAAARCVITESAAHCVISGWHTATHAGRLGCFLKNINGLWSSKQLFSWYFCKLLLLLLFTLSLKNINCTLFFTWTTFPWRPGSQRFKGPGFKSRLWHGCLWLRILNTTWRAKIKSY